MRTPKVLLVYSPIQLLPQEAPRPDGSLGPLYLAGALEDAGIQVDVLDAVLGTKDFDLKDTYYQRVEQPNGLIRVGMSFDDIRGFIERGGYNIVGIHSNFTPQTKMALEVARAAKSISAEILVVAGGVNTRNLPDRFLKSGCVDIIATTEAEKIFLKIIRNWSRNLGWDGVDGVMYNKNDKLVFVPPHPTSMATNLDILPLPRWNKLPLSHYAAVFGPHGDIATIQKRMYASIMTSRGCPFKCSYCHISAEKDNATDTGGIGELRLKSVDRVLEEIKILKNLGVVRLYFEDDSLLAKKARVKQIFERVKGMGLSIADVNGVNLVHFLIRSKTTGKLEADSDYMQILKDAGFDNIVFPVESGSQRILDKYATAKLNLATMDVVEMVRVARQIGIECPVNMMIGFPDETEAEIIQSVELGKQMIDAGAMYCSFFLPTPFPGSQLYNYAIANGHLDPNFDSDQLNIHGVSMQNTVVPPKRLMELREWAWRTVNRKDYVEARLKISVGPGRN